MTTFFVVHSPSRWCHAACRREEAKGDRAEALAKAGATLRRSLARHSSQERRRVPLGFAKDAPRLGAGCFTIFVK